MSIEAIKSERPAVRGQHDESLVLAVRKAEDCAAIWNSCADAWRAEPMDMRQCVRLCPGYAGECAEAGRSALAVLNAEVHAQT